MNTYIEPSVLPQLAIAAIQAEATQKRRKPLIFTDDDDAMSDFDNIVPNIESAPGFFHSAPVIQAVVPSQAPQQLEAPVGVSEADDEELTLMLQLKAVMAQRQDYREQAEELLYKLHKHMVTRKRTGEYTRFLNEEMGWATKHATDKAQRWIANYRFRLNEIDKEERDRIYGNKAKKKVTSVVPPLRGESVVAEHSDQTEETPAPPSWFADAETDENDEDFVSPEFTDEELAGGAEALGKVHKHALHTTLIRLFQTDDMTKLLKQALKIQKQRHGTKTNPDTLVALVLKGRIAAAPGDEWGQVQDEIVAEVWDHPERLALPDWFEDEALLERAIREDESTEQLAEQQ